MFLETVPTANSRMRGLPGTSADPFGLISSLMTGMLAPSTSPSGAAPGAGASMGPIVTTAVNTQVSPQISPVFVQQSSPSNSPIGAAPVMGTPVTGAIPGFDNASGYAPTGIPLIPSIPLSANKPLLYGSLALLGLALVLKSRKKNAKAKA